MRRAPVHLAGMHVAITGASSGIGAALARELGRAKARLTLVARRRPLMEAVAREIEGPSVILEHDLERLESCSTWLEESERALGPVDVLINNAAIQIVGPTLEVPLARGEEQIRLSLLVPLRLVRAVLPGMLSRGRGTIVNVASLAAFAPLPWMMDYNAAKAGLAASSESLRAELRGTPVHVVTVYPGVIADTAMAQRTLAAASQNFLFHLVPRGTTAELALRVRRAIEAQKARVIYPAAGALSRWFPGFTRWLLDRYAPSMKSTA